MKWLLLIVSVVMLAVAGTWYYLNNRSVIRQINRQEPGLSKSYTHEYKGTFVSLDTASHTLKLRGRDGKEYLFRVPQPLIDNRDAGVVGNTTGQSLIVEWNDGRSPGQILEEYVNSPERPLNEGTTLVSIRQVEDEK